MKLDVNVLFLIANCSLLLINLINLFFVWRNYRNENAEGN